MPTRRRILISLLAAGCTAVEPSLAQTEATLHLGSIGGGSPMTPDSPLGKMPDLAGTLTIKRLELLKAFSPTLKKIAMFWNPDNRAMTLRYQASAATAQQQGFVVQPLGVREPDDFNGAFEAMDRDKPDAILMVADSLTILNRKRVFDYAAARRLPAIYEAGFFVHEGGLMSYGADDRESLTRAASMIDRIFKGTRPGDIPFETPTKYVFAFNLKTARAMGVEPPVTLLGLADDVIE
jgi:putative ABC transport system substrate-binding protein